MKNIFPIIDYKKISNAIDFYEARGYKELSVPWIVDFEAYASTKPNDREDYYVNGGYLNASGEQSFIQMMLDGHKLSKNFCITPCFRKEPMLDETHHLYFVKLELINTDASEANLSQMIKDCKELFESYMKYVDVVETSIDGKSFDLIERSTGVELGSYGIRQYKDFKWIYGTGIALPRFDTVLSKIKNNS